MADPTCCNCNAAITAPRARARHSTAATGARSSPPGIRGCGRRRAAHSHTTCARRVHRRRESQGPGVAASVEWVRAARRAAAPRRRPQAVERGLRRSPSPLRGTAATMQPHWLAGSAKRRSRPALRPDNARRNRRGRRRARRRLATAGIFCLRRQQARVEEEPPVPLPRPAVRLPLGKQAWWRPARVPATLVQPRAPRSLSAAVRRRRAPPYNPAILWRHCA
jgi:hypothetical protein